MAATVTHCPRLLLSTVGLAVVAVAWGVLRRLQMAKEQDTTTYLLRGANGDALRAAIGRRGQGRYVA